MKRIYIAGPMTGIEDLNRAEFEKAEGVLHGRKCFETVWNPSQIAVYYGWNEKTNLCTIASTLLQVLTRCTHIYMLRGWQDSKGATAEHAVAKWIGLEIIYQGEEE